MPIYSRQRGFTLIELLVVVFIIGVLAALVSVAVFQARQKAQDARILNDMRQIKWLAEIAYNGQEHSFLGWITVPDIQEELNIVLADIEEALGVAGQVVMVDTETQDYCISVPLMSAPGRYYCTDRGSGVKIVNGACPVLPPVLCPS